MKKLLLTFSLIGLTSTINAQWTSQGTGFNVASRGLNEIKIVDANTVWALAYDGAPITATHTATDNVQQYTRTTDGGATWTSGPIEMGDATLEINNISPVNGLTAWVSALVPTDGNGVVYKTIDGGTTWTQQLATGFQTSSQSFLNGVYFWDANTGVAYGDPIGTGASRKFEIWRTTNGGMSWNQVVTSGTAIPLANEYGYNAPPSVAGGVLWFTTDKGRLIKTTDMGATWTGVQTPLTDFSGLDATTGNGTAGNVYFSDANTGFLLKTVIAGTTTSHTYARTFYTTTNGGSTWSASAAFTGTRFILNYIPNTTTIVATSLAAPVGTSISTNNGASWTDLEPTGTSQRGTSAFLNVTTGWCAGFSDGNPLGSAGVFKLSGSLGLDNAATVAKFKVYPNPTSSVVTISTPDVETVALSVTDLTGKLVMTKSLNGIENTLDISSLSTGTYFFELSSDNKKDVIKILKN